MSRKGKSSLHENDNLNVNRTVYFMFFCDFK